MRNLNKKGVSDIISTVLILVLTIAVIGTLANQIFHVINSPALSPESSCPVLSSKNIAQIIKACYNSETLETEITLDKNNQNIKIKSLSFLLDETPFSCGNNCGTCQILQEETQTYYFNKEAKQLSLFVNNCFIEQKAIKNC